MDGDLLIFERGVSGRRCATFPDAGEATTPIPESMRRDAPPALPEVSELELVRHYTALSRMNFSIDTQFYPLGSCTMKYNPKVTEALSQLPGFTRLHPEAGEESAQGTLTLMADIQDFLANLTGMKQVTLNPCAGAHGELCGMMMIRAYHNERQSKRTTVLVPDSAHGTNPASATMVGYQTVEVKSNAQGLVDLEDLEKKLNGETAALMLTNPNTLGLFEKDILEISRMAHAQGALLYYDGANLNAIAGIVRPGDMGFDVVHLNLHKTFATPHGGGGPGSGPVGVGEKLLPYLPVPVIERNDDTCSLNYDKDKSIGPLSTFYGNVGVALRAYTYIRLHGLEGLRRNSEHAVLGARYLRSRLQDLIPPSHPGDCMHEFVLTMKDRERFGDLNAMLLAKNLIDRGFTLPRSTFPSASKRR